LLLAGALLGSDIGMCVLSFAAAFYLRFGLEIGPSYPEVPPLKPYAIPLTGAIVLLALIFHLFGLYREVKERSTAIEIALVFGLVTCVTTALMAGAFLYRGFSYSRLTLMYFWIAQIILVSLGRLLIRAIAGFGKGDGADPGDPDDNGGNTKGTDKSRGRPYDIVKCVLDFFGAVIGIVIFSPILVLITILIRLDSRGPALHYRNVMGKNGNTFHLLKFRSMIDNADQWLAAHPEFKAKLEEEYKLENDPRITQVGSFIRKSSIDELPQLFNVLIGQMSLVGPRPVVPKELSKHRRWRQRLLEVRPGITGMWQVEGRNELSYAERVKFNLYYIKHRSLSLDAKILAKTVLSVISGRGAQ
jgi:lipopolysaccharide/colanic/teichoic acid biosynthesis glycosyltransferase